jgi:diguanylate cyclase (GGDEF)-like protein
VLLPETDPTGAFVLAEKIRIGVNELELDLPDDAVRPSLSVGVVAFPDDGQTTDELMISADRAMYTSKRAGKNRVTGVSMPPDATGVPSKRGVASKA